MGEGLARRVCGDAGRLPPFLQALDRVEQITAYRDHALVACPQMLAAAVEQRPHRLRGARVVAQEVLHASEVCRPLLLPVLQIMVAGIRDPAVVSVDDQAAMHVALGDRARATEAEVEPPAVRVVDRRVKVHLISIEPAGRIRLANGHRHADRHQERRDPDVRLAKRGVASRDEANAEIAIL